MSTQQEQVGKIVYEFIENRFNGKLEDHNRLLLEHPNLPRLGIMLRHAIDRHMFFLKELISGYELRGCIGRGGFGEVYYAVSTGPASEKCALKIVSRQQFGELIGIRHYKRCIQNHANLVPVHDVRDAGDRYMWYTMGLADNYFANSETRYRPKSLSVLLSNANKPRRLPLIDLFKIAIEVASGLSCLHENGLAHRDVKPGNIICINNNWHLGDIGLVTEASQTQGVAGTKLYWPPEGLTANSPKEVLWKADLYALGLTLLQSLFGPSVLEFKNRLEEVNVRKYPEAVRPVIQLLMTACDPVPINRFISAQEMKNKFEQAKLNLVATPSWFKRVRRLINL